MAVTDVRVVKGDPNGAPVNVKLINEPSGILVRSHIVGEDWARHDHVVKNYQPIPNDPGTSAQQLQSLINAEEAQGFRVVAMTTFGTTVFVVLAKQH